MYVLSLFTWPQALSTRTNERTKESREAYSQFSTDRSNEIQGPKASRHNEEREKLIQYSPSIAVLPEVRADAGMRDTFLERGGVFTSHHLLGGDGSGD